MGGVVGAAFLLGICAGYAWFMSGPLTATRGTIAIGLLIVALGGGWLLSRTPIAPELQRLGFGRPTTTRERRISYGMTFAAIVDLWVMQAVLGRQPLFLPAFGWLVATFGLLTLVNFSLQRWMRAG